MKPLHPSRLDQLVEGVVGVKWATPNPMKLKAAIAACPDHIIWTGGLAEVWARVPTRVDVLVTHGPPMGVLDRTSRGESVGCEALAEALERIRPRLHVFGHIHESYGTLEKGGTLFVNACNCNLRYRTVNPAIVVDLDGDELHLVDG